MKLKLILTEYNNIINNNNIPESITRENVNTIMKIQMGKRSATR